MNLQAIAAALARLLIPSKNPAGLTALAGLAYAAAQAVANGRSIGDPQVYLPLIAAALAFWTRTQVTPVADPRDGNGNPLKAPSVASTVQQMATWLRGLGYDVVLGTRQPADELAASPAQPPAGTTP